MVIMICNLWSLLAFCVFAKPGSGPLVFLCSAQHCWGIVDLKTIKKIKQMTQSKRKSSNKTIKQQHNKTTNMAAQERQEALEMWLEGVFTSDAATPRPPAAAAAAAAAAAGGGGCGVEVSRAEARFYEFLTAQEPAAGAAAAGGGGDAAA